MTDSWQHIALLVFGREIRLDVAVWIVSRQDRRFNISQITEKVAGPVFQSLDNLCSIGLLAQEKSRGQNRTYLRLDHPLWEVYATAKKVLWGKKILPPSPESTFEQSLIELSGRLQTK